MERRTGVLDGDRFRSVTGFRDQVPKN
jgi:hypothetical protein